MEPAIFPLDGTCPREFVQLPRGNADKTGGDVLRTAMFSAVVLVRTEGGWSLREGKYL